MSDTFQATQLTQVSGRLDEARLILFQPAEDGAVPVVFVPELPTRVQPELAILAGILAGAGGLSIAFFQNPNLTIVAFVAAALVALLAIFRSLFVVVPEGTTAILLLGGRHHRTLPPGRFLVNPFVVVSHIVSRRVIPFDVPLRGFPAQDDVRLDVDAVLTFRVTEPREFVFQAAVEEFDGILMATAMAELRHLLRSHAWSAIFDFPEGLDAEALGRIRAAMHPYGVEVTGLRILAVRPPAGYLESEEARTLAILQRREEEERRALLSLQESNRETIRREVLEADVRATEIEAQREALRLERLQERLARFPEAAAYDLERSRVEVSRALAGNTRALVQMGREGDAGSPVVLSVGTEGVPVTDGLPAGEAEPEPVPARSRRRRTGGEDGSDAASS